MKLRYTPRAERDLRAILDDIEEHSRSGARNVRRAIRSTVALIGRFPELGRRTGEADVRVIPVGRYPYLIYWIAKARTVTVIHIRHGARQPP